MSQSTVTIKVLRQDPDSSKEPFFQEYTLEAYPGMTVLEALQRAYGNQDLTLAMHGYACYRLVCGLCSYKVNGKVTLTCRTKRR